MIPPHSREDTAALCGPPARPWERGSHVCTRGGYGGLRRLRRVCLSIPHLLIWHVYTPACQVHYSYESHFQNLKVISFPKITEICITNHATKIEKTNQNTTTLYYYRAFVWYILESFAGLNTRRGTKKRVYTHILSVGQYKY